MLTLDVIELNQKENIATMNKINCLEYKLHPIALRCMTAAERQQLLEDLCALPEPEFRKLLEMKIKEKQEEQALVEFWDATNQRNAGIKGTEIERR